MLCSSNYNTYHSYKLILKSFERRVYESVDDGIAHNFLLETNK